MAGYGQKLVLLWNDWQLTAAVLLSLSLHLLLLSTGGLRRRCRPRWWNKKYYWVLYIGSRWIAPLTLGILSRATKGNADADIQAFWAAFLLFHLGGVDDFTALSLEDNKLWDRRAFELAIHAVTTGYVFFRYFLDPSFRRFIVPFVLIYLAGALKYAEQVFALKRATMEALIESVLGIPDAGPDYADFMDRVEGILKSGVLPSFSIGDDRERQRKTGAADPPKADAPVSMEAAGPRRQAQTPEEAMRTITLACALFRRFKVLFADGIFSFKDRRYGQDMFSSIDASRAFKVIEMELSFVYDRLYTKASVSRTKVGLLLRVAGLLLTLAGSVCTLLSTWHARQYQLRHRCVTYTLLAGAVLTDTVILAAHLFSVWSLLGTRWLRCCSVKLVDRRRWSGRMAQSNLITFCLQKLPSESELVGFLGQLPRAILLPNGGGGSGPRPRGGLLPSVLMQELQLELQASDGFQRYFERRSLIDQIRSRSFWKRYNETVHVPVSEELKSFIFKQLKRKESQFNDWERAMRSKQAARRGATTPIMEEEASAGSGGTWGDNGNVDGLNPVFSRGDRVLHEEKIDGLDWSLRDIDFDESLLTWHIATDLCFRQDLNRVNPDADAKTRTRTAIRERMGMARELSNYLFYIMVIHPLMLSSSTTMATKRCRDTCAEARRHFLKEHLVAMAPSPPGTGAPKKEAVSEENAHASLLKVVEVTSLQASVVKGDKSKSVLWDGCFLAWELMRSMDDAEPGNVFARERKWRVIGEVWVEMLCYAAVQCGGYQHAERLKEGGELLTFVSLLMTHLGMGKHYRTEVGDVYPHLSPFSPRRDETGSQ